MKSALLLALSLTIIPASAWTAETCVEQGLDNALGAKFLHQLYPTLHLNPEVEQAVQAVEALDGKSIQNAQKKIAAWISVIDRTHMGKEKNPAVLRVLKNFYYRENVITEDRFPESFFDLQKKIALKHGRGDITFSAEERKKLMATAIENQKTSLDAWLDYLTSSEAAYPTWAKIWAFEGMTRIGKLDVYAGTSTKRTPQTTGPFVAVDRQALSLTIREMENYLQIKQSAKNKAQWNELKESWAQSRDSELCKAIEKGNFAEIYAWYVRASLSQRDAKLAITDGKWVRYPKGSDATPLFKSLQCSWTGWCTEVLSTAESQVNDGDFYVYYSKDLEGQFTTPRIAIRMEDNQMIEVRGIGSAEEMDSIIANTDILPQKLKEFGEEGAKFLKASQDAKRLAQIDAKTRKGQEISDEDLRFLYELDSSIDRFGNQPIPRIRQLRSNRIERNGLARVFGIKPEEVSLTNEEALSGKAKIHFGDLVLDLSDLTSAQDLKLPEKVEGSIRINLSGLTSPEGLKVPEAVYRGFVQEIDLDLSGLTSAKGFKLPHSSGSHQQRTILNFGGLKSGEGLEFPAKFFGTILLKHLTSIHGLKLPKDFKGTLDLSGLTSGEGLTLPDRFDNGVLNLSHLKSARGLKLPSTFSGTLDLSGLTTAEGLELPVAYYGGPLKLPASLEGQVSVPQDVEVEWVP